MSVDFACFIRFMSSIPLFYLILIPLFYSFFSLSPGSSIPFSRTTRGPAPLIPRRRRERRKGGRGTLSRVELPHSKSKLMQNPRGSGLLCLGLELEPQSVQTPPLRHHLHQKTDPRVLMIIGPRCDDLCCYCFFFSPPPVKGERQKRRELVTLMVLWWP